MSTQRSLLVIAFLVVAVVGGGLIAIQLTGGSGGAAATPTPEALLTPVPTTVPTKTPAASPTPTEPPSATPSEAPPPSPTPSATPAPTTPPGPPATIVVTKLKVDAADDPNGRDRTLTFQAQGAGTVTATVTDQAPMADTVMCMYADGVKAGCTTTVDGSLTADTTKPTAAFKVTLRGSGIETPMVEVALTFPADAPSVTIEDARFDGTDYPETNGIQAIITPRADGNVKLVAEWGGHPFPYDIELVEINGPGSVILDDQPASTRVSESLPVTGTNPWKLVLRNIEGGFGTTPMTATIGWP
jgi:hypothetical protein